MSKQSMLRPGKIAVVTAIVTALLSIEAILITLFRFGKINVMPFFSGLIIPLTVILIILTMKNRIE